MRIVAVSVLMLVLGSLDVLAVRDILAGRGDVRLEWAVLAGSAVVFTWLLGRALGRAAGRGSDQPSLR